MKRYWLFAGDHYYPSGGMRDFRGSYDTMEEAEQLGKGCEWYNVADSTDGSIVCDGDGVYNDYSDDKWHIELTAPELYAAFKKEEPELLAKMRKAASEQQSAKYINSIWEHHDEFKGNISLYVLQYDVELDEFEQLGKYHL